MSGLGFPELWKAFYEEEIGSYDKLLMMSFMLASTGTAKDEDDSDEEDEEDIKADQKSSNTFEAFRARSSRICCYVSDKRPVFLRIPVCPEAMHAYWCTGGKCFWYLAKATVGVAY